MPLEVLQVLWYIVFLIVTFGYIFLDGFDLGVGVLHPFVRTDRDRRVFLNAIGPVWDGNEVWLVIIGGALFAGFPYAYATLMSAFYVPVMILIAGLIFRAVAIEVRSRRPFKWWRRMWDGLFSIASLLITLMLGLALGNLVSGLPLSENHEYIGDFGTFFRPYPILVAVMLLTLFMMHGNIYLVMKTEGELHDRLRGWIGWSILLFVILYVTTTMATLIYQPHMVERFREWPWLFVFAALNVLAIANIPRCIARGADGWAFISSGFNMLLLVGLFAVGLYPYLVRASNVLEHGLTVSNSLASAKTLGILLIIVCIGVPLALGYIVSVYYVFRGKVRLDEHSY